MKCQVLASKSLMEFLVLEKIIMIISVFIINVKRNLQLLA